ncbi:DoxX family protein [Halpernia sp. GG3]
MKNFIRVALGLAMIGAGIGHLSFLRGTFQVQVPDGIPFSKDFVVLASGIVEISFGLAMVFLAKQKEYVGLILAIFYVLISPGNIHQYQQHLDGFGLNTDAKRLGRLFFQPVLIFLTLYSTEGWKLLKKK